MNLLRKRCSNAYLAKRRSLGWPAALPPASTGPGAARPEASRAFASVTNPYKTPYMKPCKRPSPLCGSLSYRLAYILGDGFVNGCAREGKEPAAGRRPGLFHWNNPGPMRGPGTGRGPEEKSAQDEDYSTGTIKIFPLEKKCSGEAAGRITGRPIIRVVSAWI